MTGRLVCLACALLGTAVVAQVSGRRDGMFLLPGLPPAIGMTCREGRYAETGKGTVPGNDSDCQRQPGLAATAIAIDVGPSSYAYEDNPPCSGGNTDSTTLVMARSQFGAVAAAPAEVLAQLQRRASLLGRDAPALVIGSTTGGTARCQLFVLQTGVAIKDIRLIEFRARQNQASDNARCFEAKPAADSFATLLNPSTGGCAINWSGWQSATLVEDGRGIAIVAGVFKNWSHDRTRTGQLWVWYASGFAPAAPRNLRIVP